LITRSSIKMATIEWPLSPLSRYLGRIIGKAEAKVFMQAQLTIVIGEMKNEGSSLLTLDSNCITRI
jgi:hypothetical protein